MTRKTVVITQNVTLIKEAMGENVYRKICTQCRAGIRAKSRNRRNCPKCGGSLRKATAKEASTDTFHG